MMDATFYYGLAIGGGVGLALPYAVKATVTATKAINNGIRVRVNRIKLKVNAVRKMYNDALKTVEAENNGFGNYRCSAPKAKKTAPKAKKTAPKAKKTAPKAKKTAPKAKKTAPKAKKTAPKAKTVDPDKAALASGRTNLGSKSSKPKDRSGSIKINDAYKRMVKSDGQTDSDKIRAKQAKTRYKTRNLPLTDTQLRVLKGAIEDGKVVNGYIQFYPDKVQKRAMTQMYKKGMFGESYTRVNGADRFKLTDELMARAS